MAFGVRYLTRGVLLVCTIVAVVLHLTAAQGVLEYVGPGLGVRSGVGAAAASAVEARLRGGGGSLARALSGSALDGAAAAPAAAAPAAAPGMVSAAAWPTLPIESIAGEGVEGLRDPKWIARRDASIVELKEYLVTLYKALGGTRAAWDAALVGRRAVIVDWGAADYEGSIRWLLHHHEWAITEVHAWERHPSMLSNSLKEPQLEEMRAHNVSLFKHEGKSLKAAPTPGDASQVDAIAWLLGPEPHLAEDDYVFLKIDIENEEWAVLDAMTTAGAWRLIDEVAIELHYKEPALEQHGWGWKWGDSHNRTHVKALLRDLRERGVRAHYWP